MELPRSLIIINNNHIAKLIFLKFRKSTNYSALFQSLKDSNTFRDLWWWVQAHFSSLLFFKKY